MRKEIKINKKMYPALESLSLTQKGELFELLFLFEFNEPIPKSTSPEVKIAFDFIRVLSVKKRKLVRTKFKNTEKDADLVIKGVKVKNKKHKEFIENDKDWGSDAVGNVRVRACDSNVFKNKVEKNKRKEIERKENQKRRKQSPSKLYSVYKGELDKISKSKIKCFDWSKKKYHSAFFDWLEWKHTQYNFTFKNEKSLKACYNRLVFCSNESNLKPKDLIERCIGNGWAGIHSITDQNKNNKPKINQVIKPKTNSVYKSDKLNND